MTTFTFRTIRRLGERPAVAVDHIAFVAPRPLFGTEVDLDLGRAGQTVVRPDADNLAAVLDYNHRMDASVVEWITRDELVTAERARLTAEYGADAVAAIDDDDVISCAAPAAPTVLWVPMVATP